MFFSNKYRVPKKVWKRWSDVARGTFNNTYAELMSMSPGDVCCHPRQPPMKPVHWKTLAWNSAWIGAESCDKALKHIAKS